MARTLEEIKRQDFGVTSNTSELMAAAADALEKYMQPDVKAKALKALQDTLQSEGIEGREFARSGDGRTIGEVADLYYNGLVNGLDKGKEDGTPTFDRHGTPFDHKYLTESLNISAKDTAIRADAIQRTEVRDAEIAATQAAKAAAAPAAPEVTADTKAVEPAPAPAAEAAIPQPASSAPAAKEAAQEPKPASEPAAVAMSQQEWMGAVKKLPVDDLGMLEAVFSTLDSSQTPMEIKYFKKYLVENETISPELKKIIGAVPENPEERKQFETAFKAHQSEVIDKMVDDSMKNAPGPTMGERASGMFNSAKDKAAAASQATLNFVQDRPGATAAIAAALAAGTLLLPNKEKEVPAENGQGTETVKKPGMFKKVVAVLLGAVSVGTIVNLVQEKKTPGSGWVAKVAQQAAERLATRGGVG